MKNQTNSRFTTFRTIYLVILCIVTIAAIVFGTFYYTGTGFDFGFDHGKYQEKSWSKEDLSGPFTGLDIQVNVSDVEIIADDKPGITFDGRKNLTPTVHNKNGVWTITQKAKNKVLGTTFFGFHRHISRLKVHIPSNASLDSVQVSCKMGDLKLKGLRTKSMDLGLSAGDLTLTGSHIEELTAKLSMGDFDIKECKIHSTDADLSMGDLSAKQIEIGNFSADLSMGDCTLKSKTDLTDAAMDLRTSLGDVTVNKKDQGNKYCNSRENGAEHIIRIKNSMGDIDLLW